MRHSSLSLVGLACGLALGTGPSLLAQPPGFSTYGEMVERMTTTASSFPSISQVVDLNAKYGTPKTWQNQSLFAMKISDNVTQEEDEPHFLMVAAHHGNEFGTPVVAMDAIRRLTTGYGNDPTITALVDGHEIWIVPVCNPDGYPSSRKNRRPGGGVDMNRNYPFLWTSPCSGSSFSGSGTYKGPAPGSEPEVKTIMALSEDQRFTKVLDYHSSGRETLYAYRCSPHQLVSYLRAEAILISQASSYGGRVRPPSAEAEHYHWQLGNYSNLAVLTEIDTTQSPTFSRAQNEAVRLWPGTVFMLQRPIPVSGHVTDAASGQPIEVDISYLENPFTQGERNRSEPRFGRYHAFLPLGNHTLRFEHPCYVTQDVPVTVTAGGVQMDVAMQRVPGFTTATATPRNGTGVNPSCLSSNRPILGETFDLVVTPNAAGATAGAVVSTQMPATGPVLGGLGEVLVDPQSTVLFTFMRPTDGGPVAFNVPVPMSTSALGFTGTVQGAVLFGGLAGTLCNAVDFTLGCP